MFQKTAVTRIKNADSLKHVFEVVQSYEIWSLSSSKLAAEW